MTVTIILSLPFSALAILAHYMDPRQLDPDAASVVDTLNPLLDVTLLPRFSTIKPSHVMPGIIQAAEEYQRKLEKFVRQLEGNQSVPRTWELVEESLEVLQFPFFYSWQVVTHLLSVKSSPELREAHQKVQPIFVNLTAHVDQNLVIYNAFKVVLTIQMVKYASMGSCKRATSHCWPLALEATSFKAIEKIVTALKQNCTAELLAQELSQGNQSLDTPQQRILRSFLMSSRHGGAELNERDKTKLNLMSLNLIDSTTKFRDNVLDSTKAFSLLHTDKESVEGLPEPTRRLLASNAVEGTNKSVDPEAGPWKVTLDLPSYGPFMKHSRNRKLREDLYHAYITRTCSGKLNNSKLIEQIRQFRQETSAILGYKNYAYMSLSSKMVQQVEDVWAFLNSLHNKSYTVAQAELQSLKEFAQSHGHSGELEHWDLAFWSERQYEAVYGLTEEKVRPYFPLERVLQGMFKLCKELFGVTIHAADGAAEVWHPDVRFFTVYDEKADSDCKFALRLNPENFYHGLYEESPCLLLPGSLLSARREEQRCLDGGIPQDRFMTTVTDYPFPQTEGPSASFRVGQTSTMLMVETTPSSLLTYTSVTIRALPVCKVLHRPDGFGHALQHMLTTVEYAGASGIHNIEWDAIEVASQFMENWLYDWDTISFISGHYLTGEPLPKEMFQEFYRARQYLGGSSMLSQLYIAALDMELHTSSDSWMVVNKRISDIFAVPKPLPEDCTPCTISHIFGGDAYAAGYYSYKWSELLAQDAFEAFSEVGLQNRDKVIKVGRRFRDTFLSLGGGTPPLEVFRNFRGRDPSPYALLRKYGLL